MISVFARCRSCHEAHEVLPKQMRVDPPHQRLVWTCPACGSWGSRQAIALMLMAYAAYGAPFLDQEPLPDEPRPQGKPEAGWAFKAMVELETPGGVEAALKTEVTR